MYSLAVVSGRELPQVRLDVLHRSHLLILRRHRSAQDLEVQLLDPQSVCQWLKDPEAVV